MALNGVGRIRIEYAPGVLDRFTASVSPTDARSAFGGALELGIGRVISGTIVAIGHDIRIGAQIHDVTRNRMQFEVSRRARPDNIGAVVDSIAAEILVRRAVSAAELRRVSAREFASRSPQALQAYLVARQHVRARQRRAAADSLKSALRHDPDFALAWQLLHRLEASQGGTTGIRKDSIERMILARRTGFPERIQDIFADARFSDRLRAREWVNALVARYPDDPDVAFHFADHQFHHGINLGESPDKAIQAFRRAYELDDEDPELRDHYAGLLSEAGDSSGLKALRHEECRRRRMVPCEMGDYYRAVFRREDPLTMPLYEDTLIGTHIDNFLLRSAAFDPALGLALTDSFAQRQLRLQRTPGQRSAAYLLRANVALARGRFALASEWLDSAQAFMPRPGFVLLHHIVTGARGDEATAIAKDSIPRGSTMSVARAWWAAATQSADLARTYLPAIEQPAAPVASRGFTNGLQGLIALRTGDTSAALRFLEAMRPDRHNPTVPNRLLFPGSYLALTHARLEARRGNFARARTYLADLYPINEYVPFIADAEELRGEVALALGDTVRARRHLGNVVAVWRDAEPALQPRVARARDLLATLK
jgi:tetratricopeptide (TPR) repeat protein